MNKNKYYPVLDLIKCIAAVMVVTLHAFPSGSTTEGAGIDSSSLTMMLGQSFIHALLRIAVPLFFVISSFLLFKRIEQDPENKWRHIGKFCLRILFLYAFWYILGLPLVIEDIVDMGTTGNTDGIIKYVVITLWKGSPHGFWYLVTLVLSVLITGAIKSKKSLIVVTVISSLMYLYGCLNSAYFGLFTLSEDPVSKAFYTIGDFLQLNICPLQGLLYVVLGKIFASYGPFKIKGNPIIIPFAYFLMAGEIFLTLNLKIFVYPDAFLSLPIFVFFFMNQMLLIDSQNEKFIKVMKKLRKVGSFLYLFHFQFFFYTYWICDSIGHNIFREKYYLIIIPFIVCLFAAYGLQTLCEFLSKYKALRFLKYSY